MNDISQVPRRSRAGIVAAWLWALALVAAAAGCGGNRVPNPAETANPDKFLFDRGTAALADRKWADAREYFRQVVDNYPGSLYRADAKLGIGDTFLGEDSAESLVLAANEYREFLSFFPTNPRADYAQFKLGMTHFEQMRAPERDQSETRAALQEFQAFFDRYGPKSSLTPEVRMKWREARDRLSRYELGVGMTYYRLRWYTGAIPRLRTILKEDPEFMGRDEVYFHLAESLARSTPPKVPEAITYFQRLLDEFETSERLEVAKKRVEELKAQVAPTTPQPSKAQ